MKKAAPSREAALEAAQSCRCLFLEVRPNGRFERVMSCVEAALEVLMTIEATQESLDLMEEGLLAFVKTLRLATENPVKSVLLPRSSGTLSAVEEGCARLLEGLALLSKKKRELIKKAIDAAQDAAKSAEISLVDEALKGALSAFVERCPEELLLASDEEDEDDQDDNVEDERKKQCEDAVSDLVRFLCDKNVASYSMRAIRDLAKVQGNLEEDELVSSDDLLERRFLMIVANLAKKNLVRLYQGSVVTLETLAAKASDLPLALRCPLTSKLMRDPVLLCVHHGKTFEKEALQEALKKSPFVDPILKRIHASPLTFVPNLSLKTTIDNWLKGDSTHNFAIHINHKEEDAEKAAADKENIFEKARKYGILKKRPTSADAALPAWEQHVSMDDREFDADIMNKRYARLVETVEELKTNKTHVRKLTLPVEKRIAWFNRVSAHLDDYYDEPKIAAARHGALKLFLDEMDKENVDLRVASLKALAKFARCPVQHKVDVSSAILPKLSELLKNEATLSIEKVALTEVAACLASNKLSPKRFADTDKVRRTMVDDFHLVDILVEILQELPEAAEQCATALAWLLENDPEARVSATGQNCVSAALEIVDDAGSFVDGAPESALSLLNVLADSFEPRVRIADALGLFFVSMPTKLQIAQALQTRLSTIRRRIATQALAAPRRRTMGRKSRGSLQCLPPKRRMADFSIQFQPTAEPPQRRASISPARRTTRGTNNMSLTDALVAQYEARQRGIPLKPHIPYSKARLTVDSFTALRASRASRGERPSRASEAQRRPSHMSSERRPSHIISSERPSRISFEGQRRPSHTSEGRRPSHTSEGRRPSHNTSEEGQRLSYTLEEEEVPRPSHIEGK